MNSLWAEHPLARGAPAVGAGAFSIVVVDRRCWDYAPLFAQPRRDVWWQFLSSARQALAAARNGPVDLWVINTSLPDRSGLDLCRMLREGRAAEVFLVADRYDAKDELAARASGAAVFACKPVRADWLDGLIICADRRHASHRRSTA
jgi:DNA-binding response OmpR family regulator